MTTHESSEEESEDQKLARHLFLELIQLGEGASDTRRRVPVEEPSPPGHRCKSFSASFRCIYRQRQSPDFAFQG